MFQQEESTFALVLQTSDLLRLLLSLHRHRWAADTGYKLEESLHMSALDHYYVRE